MKTEYILCAAIKRNSPKECFQHYRSNDIYDIELGYRHADILNRFNGEVSKNPNAQGFYTSCGRFVDRKEAYKIALIAGQIDCSKGVDGELFSEDLY